MDYWGGGGGGGAKGMLPPPPKLLGRACPPSAPPPPPLPTPKRLNVCVGVCSKNLNAFICHVSFTLDYSNINIEGEKERM